MSGFFTLAGAGRDQEQEDQNNHNSSNNNNSLFLFRNDEIYDKNFELWQQSYQLNHQPKQPHQLQQHVDLSLLGSSNRLDEQSLVYNSSDRANNGNNNNNNRASGFGMMRPYGGGSSSSGSGTISCQDCGNQAKKDCIYMRCRTCCKSQGFQCQTHVKSTWVPAAKRRERQQVNILGSSPNSLQLQDQQHQNQQLSLMRGEAPKRPRENPLASHPSGLQVNAFPAEVNSPAVFRCVRVSSVDETDEQFAYHTAVNIGGHVFKGLLYDQGPQSSTHYGIASESFPGAQQPLNLIASTGAATASNNPPAWTNDSSVYPTPLNAFMAGTQFFPPPR
ncbi:protein SHI RELATED SEQUENCE 1 [Daucus carota subsp. sativus]|uniref:Uncharacterized protein n=1 Tax=Daucus carota subsp. sativus TaxID=79200 RepID=A0A161XRM9_DAUCS|nr:PREDICTED: protein SHI RELATED SEQUENCE 1-like [Daucus carota subsp. sativus]